MTGEKVDYHLLVSKFKDLSIEISEFPKKKVFWSRFTYPSNNIYLFSYWVSYI